MRNSGSPDPADHVLDRRDLGVDRLAQLLGYAEHVKHAGERRINRTGHRNDTDEHLAVLPGRTCGTRLMKIAAIFV